MGTFDRLRTMTGRLGRLRATLAAALLLLIALFAFAHLWPDERLSAEVERLRRNGPAPSTEPMTLAYGLFGLTAPPGRDIWQYGRFFVDVHRATGAFPADPEPPLEATIATKDLCRLHEDGCLAATLAALPETPALLEANAELMARYTALHGARSFGEVLSFSLDSPLPRMEEFSIAHRLTLRAAWWAFERGQHAEAWRMLDAELAFHRRMLAESSSLIGKMIALRLVEQDLRLHAQLTARAAQRKDRAGFPAGAPARLSLPERSMVLAMNHEAMFFLNHFEWLGRDRAAITEPFGYGLPTGARLLPYQPNATINRAMRPVLDAAKASLLAPDAFEDYAAGYSLPQATAADWFFNTIGATIYGAQPEYFGYLRRCHDLDALLVLAQVAHRLQAERVSAAGVDAALAALPVELRDPFDGAAPVWREGVLSFSSGPERERTIERKLPLAL